LKAITDAQDLFLRSIGACGQRNALDGPAVEASLRSNTGLWRSAFFTREASSRSGEQSLASVINLVVLRDLAGNVVNLDTLFLLAEPGRQDELEALASGWNADEIDWVDQQEAFRAMGEAAVRNRDYTADPERVLLRVWWD
jgi:hypothetical protein